MKILTFCLFFLFSYNASALVCLSALGYGSPVKQGYSTVTPTQVGTATCPASQYIALDQTTYLTEYLPMVNWVKMNSAVSTTTTSGTATTMTQDQFDALLNTSSAFLALSAVNAANAAAISDMVTAQKNSDAYFIAAMGVLVLVIGFAVGYKVFKKE